MSSQSTEGYRLSPIQRRIWSISACDRGSDYRLNATVRIEGMLNTEILRQAIEAVVQRHEALRTVLHLLPGISVPVQVVNECERFTLHEVDAEEGFAEHGKAQVGAALKVTIARLNQQCYLLRISAPAISMDAQSLQLAVAEIASVYGNLQQGNASGAAHVLQYPDVSEWLNELAEDSTTAAGRKYWKQLLPQIAGGIVPVTDEMAGNPVQELVLELDPEVSRKITAGEVNCKWKTSEFVLAAWMLLLQRLGFEPGCIAVACDGRTEESLLSAVGPLTRYLPVLSVPGSQKNFIQAVHETAASLQEVSSWQEYFLQEVFQEEHGNKNIFFAFGFDYTNLSDIQPASSTKFKIEDIEGRIEHLNLRLSCQQSSDTIKLRLNWSSAVYDFAKVATVADSLAAILSDAVERPDASIADLSIVGSRTKKKLLYDNNRTTADFSKAPFIHKQFSIQAAKTPHAPAVIYKGEEFTYAELNRRVLRVAHNLTKRGVGPESLVGICLERSTEMVVALLGVLKAGGAYVPLDPSYPEDRLNYMLKASKAKLVLTSVSTKVTLNVPDTQVITIEELQKSEVPCNGIVRGAIDGQNPAYVIYTSGSTGEPKGVMLSHDAIRNHMAWMQQEFPLGRTDRVLQKTAFSFDASVWEFYAPLLAGGVLVMARPGGQADAEYLVSATRENQITVLQLVPTQLRMMLEQPAFNQCQSLKRVYCGGEPLEEELVKAFYQRLPHARLHNLYGPTEATIDATFADCKGEGTGIASIGKPVSNTQVYVLNEAMNLVPEGVQGELYIGGAGLARGYVNRPDLTADRFVPNPFSRNQGERLYRTGDHVQWLPDGTLKFFGRLDHQVKLRGFRIELGEIETVLQQCPGVKQAVVVVREDRPGDKQLVAYLTSDSNEPLSETTVRAFAKERLPEYMAPAACVVLDKFPLMPNGKVSRKSLPIPEAMGQTETYVGPTDQVEEILCGIFAEVLRREQVSTQQSFFEMGGHSLVATQVISRIRMVFAIEIPLRALFESPTVAGLSEKVREARAEESALAPIEKTSRGEQDILLSYAQQRLWFLDQLEPASPAYNMPFGLRLKGKLDRPALQQALNEIVRRHEILRTRFTERGGVGVQEIARQLSVKIQFIDLRSVASGDREEKAKKLAQAEAEQPFKLARGPLVRLKLIQMEEQEHVLLLTMHHIVSDGWSMGVMVRELTQLYDTFLNGRSSSLVELPIQYADYSVWQRNWLQGAVLEEQLEYWRKQLDGVLALELPSDRIRPSVPTYAGASERILLGKGLTEELKRLSQREGATLFMTLLASFQILLARYSGQWDVAVGTDVAYRNRKETEDLIGFFVNTLVLRNKMDARHSFREVLRNVREVTLTAYTHQDLPFEKLVEVLDPERHLDRNPLFQVLFTMQNMPLSDVHLTALQVTPEPAATKTAKLDLNLIVGETSSGINVVLEYSSDLFDSSTIQGMLGHWQVLLQGVTANPECPVAELPLMTAAEWLSTGIEFNCTEKSYPAESFVHQLFEQQVERTPQALAATYGGQAISYLDLNRQANKLANHLREKGVGPDATIALLMDRSIEFLTAVLAVFKAGGAYLPLDPNHPYTRHEQILRQSGVPRLITTRQFAEGTAQPTLDIICIEDVMAGPGNEQNPLPVNKPADLAYVIYTSGSTGIPKGAMVEHRGMLNHLYAKIYDLQLGPSDVIVQNASQCFDISVWQFLAGVLVGAQVHIVPNEIAVDPRGLFADIAAHAVTVLETVPSMLRAALEEISGGMAAPELNTLHWLLLTGEALPAELVRRWLELYPGIPVMNAYGPTECSDDVTHHVVREASALNSSYTPIGRPIINTRLYVLDQLLQPVPIGLPGELYVGGICVGRGYLNDPQRTREAFLPDKFAHDPGARLYRTGDLVRMLPSGEIIFLGRTDHQIKLRGYRIELGEIESALEQHEALAQAVVVLREDQPNTQRLVAYIVSRRVVEAAELRAALKQRLPEYMVPSVFVVLEQMPLTLNGKIDRKALPVPSSDDASRDETYIAPRTPEEQAIAEIWAEVLKTERIGVEDNFFDLGGHSLLATQVISRTRSVMGVELPLRTLFEAPTVSGLASAVIEYRSTAPAVEAGVAARPIQKDLSIEQMLAGLENLSEEEVELLLSMETHPG